MIVANIRWMLVFHPDYWQGDNSFTAGFSLAVFYSTLVNYDRDEWTLNIYGLHFIPLGSAIRKKNGGLYWKGSNKKCIQKRK